INQLSKKERKALLESIQKLSPS
ncbi:XRE family transcriptional regulator, partial [Vibrio anguillarum]|nr:XRE family transcriptional regulator [Vibrio anguillarum]MBF4442580.1 XRE family transcriptional regulator [Vibrio anguillarum]